MKLNKICPYSSQTVQKLINSKLLSSLGPCVQSGKESRIYLSLTPSGTRVITKIFYLTPDTQAHRNISFSSDRRYTSVRNNRIALATSWAEKEARNIAKLHNSSINAPKLYLVHRNAIIMSLVGEDSQLAPTLKEHVRLLATGCDTAAIVRVYVKALLAVRAMCCELKMIHCDLSEYNLLLWRDEVFVIDVGQSVPFSDCERSREMVVRDFRCLNKFFERKIAVFRMKWILYCLLKKKWDESKGEEERFWEVRSSYGKRENVREKGEEEEAHGWVEEGRDLEDVERMRESEFLQRYLEEKCE